MRTLDPREIRARVRLTESARRPPADRDPGPIPELQPPEFRISKDDLPAVSIPLDRVVTPNQSQWATATVLQRGTPLADPEHSGTYALVESRPFIHHREGSPIGRKAR